MDDVGRELKLFRAIGDHDPFVPEKGGGRPINAVSTATSCPRRSSPSASSSVTTSDPDRLRIAQLVMRTHIVNPVYSRNRRVLCRPG